MPNRIITNAFGTIKHQSLTSLVIFIGLISFSDAILSYWVPSYLENTFEDPIIMGLIMSFSSIIGLIMDMYLPQILHNTKTQTLMFASIICSFLFALILFFTKLFPLFILFFLAVGIWGIYYELIGFTTNQYVANHVDHLNRSRIWSLITTVKSLAYFLGPLIVGFILIEDDYYILFISMFLTLCCWGVMLFSKWERQKNNQSVKVNYLPHFNPFQELKHWKTLIKPMWTIIVLSIFLGLIDSIFWTTGAVWAEKLSEITPFGGMLISVYMLPSLFIGFILVKIKIANHKKRIAELSFILSCLTLACIYITDNILFILAIVFLASTFFSITIPFIDATFSDLISRMGKQHYHLIGLTNSTYSLAYIIGPIIGGILSAILGAQTTIALIGLIGFVFGIIILITTPKKIHLPQVEIHTWK